MGCFYHYCLCQESRPSLGEEAIEHESEKRPTDRKYIKRRGYDSLEKWECEWWSFYKTDESVEQNLKVSSSKIPSREKKQLEKIKMGSFFG